MLDKMLNAGAALFLASLLAGGAGVVWLAARS
jgi:hypothetical protein